MQCDEYTCDMIDDCGLRLFSLVWFAVFGVVRFDVVRVGLAFLFWISLIFFFFFCLSSAPLVSCLVLPTIFCLLSCLWCYVVLEKPRLGERRHQTQDKTRQSQ
jgi:hypothetical protein